MTLFELSNELKTMYNNAQPKEMVCMIHLFAIRYAEEIKMQNFQRKIF